MRFRCVLVLLVAACASRSEERQVPDAERLSQPQIEAYRAAGTSLDAGDPRATLAAIGIVAEIEPWHLPSHALRQDALVLLGREDEARAWYERAAQAAPTDPARLLLAARLLPRSAGAREAAYRAILANRPDFAWGRIALAYELMRRAREESARATSLADGGFTAEARAAGQRAVAARDEARRSADAAVALRPDLAAAHGAEADVLLGEKSLVRGTDAALALAAAQRAAELDGPTAASWFRLGRARRANDDDAGAAQAFAAAAALAPRDPAALANLGRVLLDRREDAGARDALAEAARLAPRDEDVAFNHGVALFRLNDVVGSAREFERAAALDPSDPRPLEALAIARKALGDPRGAVAAMQRYLEAGGSDRDGAKRFIEEMSGAAKRL